MQNELTGPKSIFNRSRRHDSAGLPIKKSVGMKKVVIKVETSQIPVVDSDSILSHPRPKNSCVLNKYMLEK